MNNNDDGFDINIVETEDDYLPEHLKNKAKKEENLFSQNKSEHVDLIQRLSKRPEFNNALKLLTAVITEETDNYYKNHKSNDIDDLNIMSVLEIPDEDNVILYKFNINSKTISKDLFKRCVNALGKDIRMM